MTSQLVIFRAFLFIFFVPPTLDLKKISRKSTNKKILALPGLFVPYVIGIILKQTSIQSTIYKNSSIIDSIHKEIKPTGEFVKGMFPILYNLFVAFYDFLLYVHMFVCQFEIVK